MTFHTLSGPLTCTRLPATAWRWTSPPCRRRRSSPRPGCSTRSAITDAVAVLDNKQWFIVEVATAAEVEALTPDLRRLEAIGERRRSRDRALGPRRRRHRLACLRARRRRRRGRGHRLGALRADAVLGAKLGTTELVAYQASARGGTLHCRLDGDRVFLAGPAVTVMRGELDV